MGHDGQHFSKLAQKAVRLAQVLRILLEVEKNLFRQFTNRIETGADGRVPNPPGQCAQPAHLAPRLVHLVFDARQVAAAGARARRIRFTHPAQQQVSPGVHQAGDDQADPPDPPQPDEGRQENGRCGHSGGHFGAAFAHRSGPPAWNWFQNPLWGPIPALQASSRYSHPIVQAAFFVGLRLDLGPDPRFETGSSCSPGPRETPGSARRRGRRRHGRG